MSVVPSYNMQVMLALVPVGDVPFSVSLLADLPVALKQDVTQTPAARGRHLRTGRPSSGDRQGQPILGA